MENYWIVGLWSATGLLFLVAAGISMRPLRTGVNRWSWASLSMASLALAGAAGTTAYNFWYGAPYGPNDWISGGLFLGAGILSCLATAYVGSRTLLEQRRYRELQGEMELFRIGFEKNPQIALIKDRQGNYMFTNQAFLALLGKKDQNLVGESDQKFFPRAQAMLFKQEEEKILETSIARTRDEEIRGIDGVHWLRITRTPVMGKDKTVIGILVTGEEITPQKQAETRLNEWKSAVVRIAEADLALRELTDSSATWEKIAASAARLCPSAHTGIWHISADQTTAILRSGTGKLSSMVGVQVKGGEDLVWKVWQNGQPVTVADYSNWANRGAWLGDCGFSGAAGIPLKSKSQVLFVITLFYDKPGQIFSEEQIQWLSFYAQLASSKLQSSERSAVYQSGIEEWQHKHDTLMFRTRLEHVMAVIATHFINLDLEKLDETISRSLQTIARYSGTDRCYLALFRRSGLLEDGPQPYFYTSDTEKRGDFTDADFQTYLSKLSQMEIVHIPRVKELNAEREEGTLYLQTRGIKSFTAIPLVSNRNVVGFWGFESLRGEIDWSQDILTLLKSGAEMFVNLLERRQFALEVKNAQEKMGQQINSLELRSQEISLQTEMGELLQACRTADEAYPIIIRYLQRLIPIGSGALYMIHDPKDPAEQVANWGPDAPGKAEHELVLNECWALRRGRVYLNADPASEPVCAHIKVQLHTGYMCIPLMAQGAVVGILHLRLSPKNQSHQLYTENQQHLAVKLGENIAIPLNNLKLRDELRGQAIRDPLTKLFNRRYMEETLEREIRRAGRHSTSVGIIMFDIDKMKPINDHFGHDAGDLVLRSLGRELLSLFRGEDVACRYGGDEFTIVLPEASLADVWRRAEQMRETVKKLDLKYDGKQIGPLTLSIGVAAFPDHGQNTERVLLACDAASYASKSEGGDRIMMGHKADS